MELFFTKPLHTSTGERSVELKVDGLNSQCIADGECLETPSWEGTKTDGVSRFTGGLDTFEESRSTRWYSEGCWQASHQLWGWGFPAKQSGETPVLPVIADPTNAEYEVGDHCSDPVGCFSISASMVLPQQLLALPSPQRKLSLQRDHHGLAGRGSVPWTRWFPHH